MARDNTKNKRIVSVNSTLSSYAPLDLDEPPIERERGITIPFSSLSPRRYHEGLIHISELAHQRVIKTSKVLNTPMLEKHFEATSDLINCIERQQVFNNSMSLLWSSHRLTNKTWLDAYYETNKYNLQLVVYSRKNKPSP